MSLEYLLPFPLPPPFSSFPPPPWPAFLVVPITPFSAERRRMANAIANNGKERKDLYTDNCELCSQPVIACQLAHVIACQLAHVRKPGLPSVWRQPAPCWPLHADTKALLPRSHCLLMLCVPTQGMVASTRAARSISWPSLLPSWFSPPQPVSPCRPLDPCPHSRLAMPVHSPLEPDSPYQSRLCSWLAHAHTLLLAGLIFARFTYGTLWGWGNLLGQLEAMILVQVVAMAAVVRLSALCAACNNVRWHSQVCRCM